MRDIAREREITHRSSERAILTFDMLSAGDADYLTFILRWLQRHEAESAQSGE